MKITKRDISIIRNLKRYAAMQGHDRRTHFSAAVAKKQVCFGINSFDPCGNKDLREHYEYHFKHAEYDALKRIEECDKVYVIRLNRKGELMNSQPCEECYSYMRSRNVGYVIYSTDGGITKEKL